MTTAVGASHRRRCQAAAAVLVAVGVVTSRPDGARAAAPVHHEATGSVALAPMAPDGTATPWSAVAPWLGRRDGRLFAQVVPSPPGEDQPAVASDAAPPPTEPDPASTGESPDSTTTTPDPPDPAAATEPAAPPYFVEVPPTEVEVAPDDTAQIIEPPPPGPITRLDVPPPPVPTGRVAPRNALWLGLRGEWLIPRGSLWSDGREIAVSGGTQTLCCVYSNRRFTDHAKSGPSLEANVGARLSRRYMVFTYWQHAFFRDGGRQPDVFGAQQGATSDLVGLGLRFSTDPSDLGFVLEIGLGYRRFKAKWKGKYGNSESTEPQLPNSGGSLVLKDEFLSSRLGLGADWRVTDRFSLSPLILFTGGAFREPAFKTNDGRDIEPLEPPLVERIRASYITITLSLGGHYDVY